MTTDPASAISTQAFITVTVSWSPSPRCVREVSLVLPAGSTAEAAVLASGIGGRGLNSSDPVKASALANASTDTIAFSLGIWGRKAAPDQVLRDRDRVEIYRPLKVDPKTARRERFAKQGAKKKAGLFAQRRSGAKPGY